MNPFSQGIGASIVLTAVVFSPAAIATEPNERAEQLLQETRAAYASLSTYSDYVTVVTDMTMGRETMPSRMTTTVPMSLAFDRGSVLRSGRLALHMPDSILVNDGERVYRSDMHGERYTVEEAPESLDRLMPTVDVLGGMAGSSTDGHPLLGLLMEGWAGAVGSPVLDIDHASGMRTEMVDQTEFAVLDLVLTPEGMDMGMMPGMGEIDVRATGEMWIDRSSGLITRLDVDMTEMMQAQFEAMDAMDEDAAMFAAMVPRIGSMTMSYTIRPVSHGQPIEAEVFAFDTEGRTEVDSLMPDLAELFGGMDMEMDFGMDAGAELVDTPAPAFDAETLAGEPISVESLRGQIVLIDFWATWCAPCIQAMPELQQLSDEFSEQGVVVLGISQDAPGMERAVRDFVSNMELTFPQVFDPDQTIGDQFEVNAYPTTVLLDRDGVIRSYGSGWRGAQVYREKIRELLGEL